MQVRPPLHLAALIHVSHAIALRGVCVCVQGRFLLSRGSDVLAKDVRGESVLSLCAEYGYDWVRSGWESTFPQCPLCSHGS
jgi:hypothetical protein